MSTHDHSLLSASDGVLVRVEALEFGYTDVALLRDMNFDIRPGLTLIRGGPGRGKTTLLRLLAGEVEPRRGTVRRRTDLVCWVASFDSPPELESEVGPSQGSGAVPPNVRAWFAQAETRFPRWDGELADALIAQFSLAEHLDKALPMLSKGSRRKLALVNAFASGAPVALLDTPFAALDGPSRRLLADLLSEAAEHRERAWVVADFELAPELCGLVPSRIIELGS